MRVLQLWFTPILFLLFASSPLIVNAQKLSDGIVIMEDTVISDLPYKKLELKTKVKNWFGDTFKNADAVITNETDDQINGNFVIKTQISSIIQSDKLSITVRFKDNKLKLEVIGDVVWTNQESHTWPFTRNYYREDNSVRQNRVTQLINIKKETRRLASSLAEYLIQIQTKDDW